MNRKRREAIGNMFLDVAKYLVTSVAVGSFITQTVNAAAFVVSMSTAVIIVAAAYYIIPQEKEE